MSKHTQGPWTTQGRTIHNLLYDEPLGDRNAIASIPDANPESHANARLIAVAPELLWALREIVNQMDQGGQGSTQVFNRDACISAARRVIAKATGE